MNVLGLITRELRYRWTGFAVSAAGIALAVAACIAMLSMHTSVEDETRRVQRDIGFNLRIIPRETDLEGFLLRGYAEETMPEEIVKRLAAHKTVAYNHLVATLEQPIDLNGKPIILTGLSPTMFPPGAQKPPLRATIEPGTTELGHHIAKRLEVTKGDTLNVLGQSFTVARVAPEAGNRDDMRVWVNLQDAQHVLDKEGRINEIQAIDCLCLTADRSPQEILRREIAEIAPEAQVAMLTGIATARARQRQLMEKLSQTAAPALAAAAALLVGVLAYINIRQRRKELGILRALGRSSATIATLVLGKAALAGLAGAAAGSLLGAAFALTYVPQVSAITGAKFQLEPHWYLAALMLAPIVAALAALIPATLAATQQPAEVLRGE
jgi:putative ABC transport system permease protein